LAPVQAPVLDDAQRRVVDHGDGRLLVLAGPGTGKTATLVEAAVARVRDGVPIEHILILTFSRRAAGELRDRVTARLGGTVREPIARTFHSYAFGVLRMAAIRDRLPQPRLLSGPEQDVIVRELIAGDLQSGAVHWPAELAPALRTRAFARELRDLLLRAVERGLDGARLAELGRVRNRPEWVAAGEFMRQYANVTSLALPGAWDPARLIRAAINVLTADSQLLARERALRRHLLVDEYQDTDPAQADLLELLAAGADELIIVGDPDQSIYRFRGADESAIRDAFRRFGDTAGELPCVALEVSRRTGPQLLAATRRVAAGLPGLPWHRHLKSADGLPPGQLDVAVLRSASEEAAYIAAVLREAHLHDGLPWSRMAVLVRSTATTLAVLRRALVTAGVPVAALGTDVPLAEQPAVAHLLTALGAALRPESINDETAEHLLLGPIGGGDALQLRRLRRELRAAGNDSSLADAISDLPDVAMLPKYVRAPVEHVARVLSVGREAAACGGTAEDVLWAVWDATGLARVWDRASRTGGPAGAAADRDLDAVLELFAAAARFVDRLPGASAEGLYEHLAAQQIPGDTLSVRPVPTEAVQILTAHASKGLEWDLVCLAAVQEGSWPDLRRRGSLLGSELLVDVLAERDIPGGLTPQLQEERRLFYVATTRARQRLVVTAVRGGDEQPSRFLDELDSVDRDRPLASVPGGLHLSGLVAELRAAACDPHANDDERRAAATELARLAAAGVSGADPASWWGLAPLSDGRPVADPEHSVPVSPSRIESFLRCELKTLLEQLGAREDDQIGASLGSLIHEVAAVAPADADLSVLEALLDERWPRLDFGAAWFAANQRERARDMLAKLVQWIRDTRGQLTLEDVEQDFTVVVGDVQLRGRVDRVERDAHGRLVVVDLKTGASKPVRGDVPTNPQLGAYQVAVAAGGFAGGNRSGGARLVQLGGTNKSYDDQWQAPLSEQDDPSWISERIDYIAARMRGSEFTAAINGYCGNCDLKVCCPLTTAGRQVTS
jgi:superfamily I DNA/RNA helicase/RecB family exonuclease